MLTHRLPVFLALPCTLIRKSWFVDRNDSSDLSAFSIDAQTFSSIENGRCLLHTPITWAPPLCLLRELAGSLRVEACPLLLSRSRFPV